MPIQKRSHEIDIDAPPNTSDSTLTLRLRNTWEFACLVQYIHIFGDTLKIGSDIDIDTLEFECCRAETSELLSEIGLVLLKNVSSHRGLTQDLFDEYARRQYVAKAPHRNPFGIDEEPKKFIKFDVVEKVRILHQLSVWTFYNPDRLRQYFTNTLFDQTSWRIEPYGWDRDDRVYFVFSDHRLYRQAQPLSLETKQRKSKGPKARSWGTRSSKRQRVANNDFINAEERVLSTGPPKDTTGAVESTWECVAVSLYDYTMFLDTISRSKNANEKSLFRRISAYILPDIERHAAAQQRKQAQQQKELINLHKMASAKRSSRIADKQGRMKELHEAEEAERRRKEQILVAERENVRQQQNGQAQSSRMLSREQRLREREVKRVLHAQELQRLEARINNENFQGRTSSRQRQSEMDRHKHELEKLVENEDEWYFDCSICGVHGKNMDDGTHSIACEKCNVWQHSSCHGIEEGEAERDDFHFLCASCAQPKQIRIHVGQASMYNDTLHEPKSRRHSLNGDVLCSEDIRSKEQSLLSPPAPHSFGSLYSDKKGSHEKALSGDLQAKTGEASQHWKTTCPPSFVFATNGYTSAVHTTSACPSVLTNALPASGTIINNGTEKSKLAIGIASSDGDNLGCRQDPLELLVPLRSETAYSSKASMHPPPSQSSPSTTPTKRTHAPYIASRSSQATPLHSSTKPIISPSSTPTFAATQGSTDVLFSSYPGFTTSSTYTPVSRRPLTAAISPTKHMSSLQNENLPRIDSIASMNSDTKHNSVETSTVERYIN